MKDIPIFDTEYGVASLILKDIPYRGDAYIQIQAVQPDQLDALIQECRSFCRMAGAERIYAAGNEGLSSYELHCTVMQMTGPGSFEPEARLEPVTAQTVELWRKICNERMAQVDNSAYKSSSFDAVILASRCYFVYDADELLGIGWVAEGELVSVASVKPGSGARVVRTLLSAQSEERVRLEVVSTNHRAIALYQRLGFTFSCTLRDWYRV